MSYHENDDHKAVSALNFQLPPPSVLSFGAFARALDLELRYRTKIRLGLLTEHGKKAEAA